MRKRLYLFILSIIFITSAIISLVIGSFSYDFIITVLNENSEVLTFRIQKHLCNSMIIPGLILSILIIAIVVFFISAGRLNSLFIKRIINITDGLKKIRQGESDTLIADHGHDEISDIVSNINQLTKTVKHQSSELTASSDELKELTLFVNKLIESTQSIIITLDENDRVIHWNHEAENFTGYSSGEAAGRILWDFIPSMCKYKVKSDQVRSSGAAAEIMRETFVRENCGAEESFIKNIFIFPFNKKDNTGVIIRVDDISEFVKNEERLNRASKVESLGTMAGGLAHDFNNIISGIIGTASYLNTLVKENNTDQNFRNNEIINHLDIIKQSGGKAAELVKNLMSVSKSDSSAFSEINLDQIVKDVIAITRSSVPVNIEVTFYSSFVESKINGNRSQIEQVILNLIVNASEALKRSNINTPVISLLLDKIEDSGMLPGLNRFIWHLSVADNGPGIDRGNLRKIFDPFFTTKSEGSGLGLAVVNSIILRHEGFIEVHSEPGSGTVFDIYLPAV